MMMLGLIIVCMTMAILVPWLCTDCCWLALRSPLSMPFLSCSDWLVLTRFPASRSALLIAAPLLSACAPVRSAPVAAFVPSTPLSATATAGSCRMRRVL
jgi:hypothetical protein